MGRSCLKASVDEARHRVNSFGVLIIVFAGILWCPQLVIAQASSSDPELHIVEPIVTEETMPNEPGDWDIRFSGSYSWQGAEGSGFLPCTKLFFGIANLRG